MCLGFVVRVCVEDDRNRVRMDLHRERVPTRCSEHTSVSRNKTNKTLKMKIQKKERKEKKYDNNKTNNKKLVKVITIDILDWRQSCRDLEWELNQFLEHFHLIPILKSGLGGVTASLQNQKSTARLPKTVSVVIAVFVVRWGWKKVQEMNVGFGRQEDSFAREGFVKRMLSVELVVVRNFESGGVACVVYLVYEKW